MTGELVANAARNFGHRQVQYIPEKENVLHHLKKVVKKGDMVITLGAGDIWKTGEELIKVLK